MSRILGQLFDQAHTFSYWQARPVPEGLVEAAFQLASLGPASANCEPLRLVRVRSPQAKEQLLFCVSTGNYEKVRTAPITATGCAPDCRASPLTKSRVGSSRHLYRGGRKKSSGPQFRDGVAAKEPFFCDRAVAVVDGHFGRLVGFGQSNGLGDRLLSVRVSTPWVIFSFLCHCPTLLCRMNTINVASQHHRFPCVVPNPPANSPVGRGVP